MVLGSGVGACSDTQLWCLPGEPVQKYLKGLHPLSRLCLQCPENQWRGFSRTCEDLFSGWTVRFCSEDLYWALCWLWMLIFVWHLTHVKITVLPGPFDSEYGKKLCLAACTLCFKRAGKGCGLLQMSSTFAPSNLKEQWAISHNSQSSAQVVFA